MASSKDISLNKVVDSIRLEEASVILDDGKSSTQEHAVLSKTEYTLDSTSQEIKTHDKFQSAPRNVSSKREFRDTLQYHDKESYSAQRSHVVGIGVFNTDEIDDLPPRHREKVRKAYDKILQIANNVIPPGFIKTTHGNPLQISDLLSLDTCSNAQNAIHPNSSSNAFVHNNSSLYNTAPLRPEEKLTLNTSLVSDFSHLPSDKNQCCKTKVNTSDVKCANANFHRNLSCGQNKGNNSAVSPEESSYNISSQEKYKHCSAQQNDLSKSLDKLPDSQHNHHTQTANSSVVVRHSNQRGKLRSSYQNYKKSGKQNYRKDDKFDLEPPYHEAHNKNIFHHSDNLSSSSSTLSVSSHVSSNHIQNSSVPITVNTSQSPKSSNISQHKDLAAVIDVINYKQKDNAQNISAKYNLGLHKKESDNNSLDCNNQSFNRPMSPKVQNNDCDKSVNISEASNINSEPNVQFCNSKSMGKSKFKNIYSKNRSNHEIMPKVNSQDSSSSCHLKSGSQTYYSHAHSNQKNYEKNTPEFDKNKRHKYEYSGTMNDFSNSSSDNSHQNTIKGNQEKVSCDSMGKTFTDAIINSPEDSNGKQNLRLNQTETPVFNKPNKHKNENKNINDNSGRYKRNECANFSKDSPKKSSSPHKNYTAPKQYNSKNIQESFGATESSNSKFVKRSLPSSQSNFKSSLNKFSENLQGTERSIRRHSNTSLSEGSICKRDICSHDSTAVSQPANHLNSSVNHKRSIEQNKQSNHEEKLIGAIGKKSEQFVPPLGDSVLQRVTSAGQSKLKECKEQYLEPKREMKQWRDHGFFIHIRVSENSSDLEFWENFLKDALKHSAFVLDYCCAFTEYLIMDFHTKTDALNALSILKKLKQRSNDTKSQCLIFVGNLKTNLIRPCGCEKKVVNDCRKYFQEFASKYTREHKKKMIEVDEELNYLKKHDKILYAEQECILRESLDTFKIMLSVFNKCCEDFSQKLNSVNNILEVNKLKNKFSRECNSFQRCLPVYSRKDNILEIVRYHPVSIVIADTGSGKSTQLAEYLMRSWFGENGIIICTQPRKIAAISITNYVCGQIGCAVGKLVGYDVGIERKCDKYTKIIYMTDYAFLKKFLRNRKLNGVSCVIVDEAHERTLYTDLLLGLLRECVQEVPRLRVIITSATIDPSVFVDFFHLNAEKAIIKIPGRTYPVEVIWLEKDVEIGWAYVEASVKTALNIHLEQPCGDVLVFLTSPSEIDEAILMFKDLCPDSKLPVLLSLHGKSDLQEQLQVFQPSSSSVRKIVFATNAAETSLTIPGIRYVVDCGMAKELVYFPESNKNSLMTRFINKSSAEQRKGRAGRMQPGVCYRLYSKANYKYMPERSVPEILKTNLQKALLKIYEFGLKPEKFCFVESPPEETISKSLDSLEQLALIKDGELTDIGKKVVKLPIDPRLSKLVLQGVEAKIGYETIIIAALMSEAGRLFVRFNDIKEEADSAKRTFCQKEGDLCTFLEVFKRWMAISKVERYDWCVNHYINFRAMISAAKTINEILINLRQELSIRVIQRYNNAGFKSHFERIVFNCFSENLCVYSGHKSIGYSSPYLTESLYIHPSSSLSYLRRMPDYVIYGTLLQTSRNFIIDIMSVEKETLQKANQEGSFLLQTDSLKCFQISSVTLGPFGESILINHILGKAGSKMNQIDSDIERLIKGRKCKLDVQVEKGIIIIYVEQQFQAKVSNYINEIIKEVHAKMAKDEDVIQLGNRFSYYCLGAGGKISDIIMPGEFKEIIIEDVPAFQRQSIQASLQQFGDLQACFVTKGKNNFFKISATYFKVSDARSAKLYFSQKKTLNVKSRIYIHESNEKSKPLYQIQISWCNSPAVGSGWVEFFSENDCIMASGTLTNSPFYLGDHSIRFIPSNISKTELDMINLPRVVDEELLKSKLNKILTNFVKVKTVFVRRKKLPPLKEKEIVDVKKQLTEKFSKFIPSNKFAIEVTPQNTKNMWTAVVYCEDSTEGDQALNGLHGKININSFPAQIKVNLESYLFCQKHIFEAVKEEVLSLKKRKEVRDISIISENVNTKVKIVFSCCTVKDLSKLQCDLMRILQGVTIHCFGKREYHFLFSIIGEQFIMHVQKRTETLIILDYSRKIISIYGSKGNCCDAEHWIHKHVKEPKKLTKKVVYDVKDSLIPSGFLKHLYSKYGLDLQGLMSAFNLEAVKLDVIEGTLELHGDKNNLKKAVDCLEEICAVLDNNDKSNRVSGGEVCAICLDSLPFDSYRLESCGHAFCKSCLVLQVGQRIVPLVCVKQDCGKDFFIEDIRKICALAGKNVKQNFCRAALQYHVNTNPGKISYCPIPDCPMVLRVSSTGVEFHCPGCDNDICIQCQTLYHKGMTCEMFQNCAKDEDYSVEVWMKENASLRKQCPHCKAVIEKYIGCNHMHCSGCDSHFCWLCLKLFSTDSEVYDHLPMCPKNQNVNE